MGRRMGVLAIAAALLGTAAPEPSAAAPVEPAAPVHAQAADTCAALDPFTAELAAVVDRRWPGHHVTAAVYDERTGCAFDLRAGQRVGTASVLKVELYAGILLRAQRAGRWLTASEAAGAWPMITESANPPATSFWSSLGGTSGMAALDRTFGLDLNEPRTPWGLTVTTAAMQVRLLRQVVVGAYGPLRAEYRAALLTAMQAVVPSQRWGISAGVPPSWPYGLKNGFADSVCCDWRINSVGWVPDPRGGGYTIAVLSDEWPSQAAGIEAVEFVAAAVAERLAAEPYGAFASRRAFVHRQFADVLGRAPSLEESLWWGAASGWGGAGAASVLGGLLGSTGSGRGDVVTGAYLAVLGRPPDSEGLRLWRAQVRAGLGVPALYAALAGGGEAASALDGLDPAGVVDLAYQRSLGRAADDAGAAFWASQLPAIGFGGVAQALAASPEGRARLAATEVVTQVYDALLGRIPAPEEVEAWAALRGADRGAIAAAVATTPEYAARVA